MKKVINLSEIAENLTFKMEDIAIPKNIHPRELKQIIQEEKNKKEQELSKLSAMIDDIERSVLDYEEDDKDFLENFIRRRKESGNLEFKSKDEVIAKSKELSEIVKSQGMSGSLSILPDDKVSESMIDKVIKDSTEFNKRAVQCKMDFTKYTTGKNLHTAIRDD
jgi:hypothetical protein